MGFLEVAFLLSLASFLTTFLENSGGGESLRTTTCHKTVFGDEQGHAPCYSGRIPTKWSLSLPPGGRDCWLPHDFGCWTLLAARWWSGVDNNNNNNMLPVKYFRSDKASFCVSGISWRS